MNRKNRNKIIIGGLVVVVVGLIWVGGGENRELQAVSPLRGDHGGNIAQAAAGQEAPDFTLATPAGEEITLSSYEGQKPVILDFFATWCPNCRRDMPRLSRWYDQYKDDVEVIGINLQERGGLVEQYASGIGISFPLVLDPQATAARAYGVQFTNFHVLINKDGTIAGTVPGDIQEGQIVSLIEQNQSL